VVLTPSNINNGVKVSPDLGVNLYLFYVNETGTGSTP
jgi:hypothetical protein